MEKAIAFLLCLCLFSFFVNAQAASKGEDVAIFIDGERFSPPTSLQIKNGNTYVPIRAFCESMDNRAIVSWNNINSTVTINCPGLEINVTVGEKIMTANGRYLYIPDECFLTDGSVMVPIRQLAKCFNAEVHWDDLSQSINVTKNEDYIECGDAFYKADDLYWLSRIIFAESGAEPLEGQIGVGNVVMNRVASSLYPDTIYSVVFDTLYGVQFTPISNGMIYNTPSELSVTAAKLVLDGADTVGDSLFFLNESIATSKWIVYNRDHVITIGEHSFYA